MNGPTETETLAADNAANAPTDPNLTAAMGLRPAQIRRRLVQMAWPILPPLGLSIVFRIVGLLAGIALLGVAGWAVMGGYRTVRLSTVVWILVGLSLVKGLARYLEQYCGHYVAFRALARLRLYFYDRLAPQAPAALEGRDTGDLLSRVTKDVDRVEVFFAHTIAPAVTAVIVPAATLTYVGVALTPWAVGPLAAGLLIVGLVSPMLRRRASARAAQQLRQARGQIAAHVRDSVQGVREVLSFDYQDRRLAELDQLGQPLGQALRTLGNATALRRGVNVAVMSLTVAAELFVLVTALDAPALIGLGLGITVAAFAPVIAVEDFAADLQQAYASARRLFEVTDAAPLVADAAPAAPLTPAEEAPRSVLTAPEVRLENVTFYYPGAHRTSPALDSVTLTAASGQVTAIVGASGSGKSTLAALLTRSWDPDSGRIWLDGQPLEDYPLAQLRSEVGVAGQRPYLFNTTIKHNLLMARPDATTTELEEAASTAYLRPVVEDRAEGWDAPVGEMAEKLSGGERQRLALARTLLAGPSVLVVDEATSQLDAASEAQVLAGLDQARAGRTVLVIAHRLATVKGADRIYVMDAGRVVQQGVYAELAITEGPFRDLLAREGALEADDLAA
ncbi:MAG: thiol reductant ABC exporter subunit CydC [Bifidobacteriaceae bacterium]|jgi:thiol reductant ABC exporter CydC subunit|nr:thiol reductant ABC exporter subunit CydC [Bifidobacteriaceae bacterium]